jgi:hypothetical protein
MSESKLSVRVNPANQNHHLWNNNGTWFIHYTRHEAGFTKRRVRESLKTHRLAIARNRRDALLSQGQASKVGCSARHQASSEVQSLIQ